MSALARPSAQAARALTAERARAGERTRSAGRSRRAEAGTLTEITRSLLRDARAVRSAEARRRAPGGGR
ncbi:MAG TPA: hypothetical protein VL979_02500 [Solirubrobacteraceae bacterium]|nr:hypothetical protein [Solirubrobacteraceae bacterium]